MGASLISIVFIDIRNVLQGKIGKFIKLSIEKQHGYCDS